MKYDLNRALLFWAVWAILPFFYPVAFAGTAPVDRRLYSELLKFQTDKKIVEVDGVPCLKVFLPPGQSLSHFCRSVRYFDRFYYFYRQQIALINRLEPMAVIDGTDNLSTDVKFIYVPLNFSIRPQLLPERINGISQLPQFILIDVGRQCLGLYVYGKLIHLFPISSGKNGTPAREFSILSKEEDHYSSKYDNAWMPYSLRLFGDYFIHGGILPSYSASHGCIRMIYENAVFVYNWVKIGTPGEIINRTASNQIGIPGEIIKRKASKQKSVVPNEEEPNFKTLY
jgi:L,D-transpeptidase catalytic domain